MESAQQDAARCECHSKRRCSKRTQRRWCDNLINALKLLANQQKDGDGPIPSIVTGMHERSRKGITEGLRNFITEENHRAVDVGHLRRSILPLHVRKPKFSEAYPQAAIREGAAEVTFGAEEVIEH